MHGTWKYQFLPKSNIISMLIESFLFVFLSSFLNWKLTSRLFNYISKLKWMVCLLYLRIQFLFTNLLLHKCLNYNSKLKWRVCLLCPRIQFLLTILLLYIHLSKVRLQYSTKQSFSYPGLNSEQEGLLGGWPLLHVVIRVSHGVVKRCVERSFQHRVHLQWTQLKKNSISGYKDDCKMVTAI